MVYLTSQIFAYPVGMAYNIASNMYLYLPLLTMGLISREISSGTIKLLYSSPVKTRDIVFGKFLALSIYGILLTAVLGMFLTVGAIHLQGPDIGLFLSIMLGVFLLLITFGSIGLFVSCLTSYQVVAAISTFALFTFLNYIGNVWQDVDVVRDITYSLTLFNRISNMASGLITTKDLFYFIVIICGFLALSILKLKGSRSTDSTPVKAFKYSAVILSALLIGYVTSRPEYTGYLDLTETKTRTLTKTSQTILKNMEDGPLEITSYINLLDNYFWEGKPVLRNRDLERWLPYLRFKSDINLKYVYYYDSVPPSEFFYKEYPDKTLDEIAAVFVKSHRMDLDFFKKPEEIRKIINLKPEQNRYVMHLKYKGKSTFLRLFNDGVIFPSERETGAALKRLTVKLPKIAFLEGELERNPTRAGEKDYKMMTSDITFRYSMVNQGFDFSTVSLTENEIPADVSGLVIADPKASFNPIVLMKIRKYIDAGGNVLIAGEPGKQPVLNPLLETLGIRMTEGMIVQQSEDFTPGSVFPYLTTTSAAFSKTLGKVFRDSLPIGMPTVTGLLYDSTNSFSVRPMLKTDERFSWRKMKALSSDSMKVNFAAADGDEKGKFTTMLALTRKTASGKEQRIIVSSDADFMSTTELNRYAPVTRNFAFNTDLFGWLSNGEFPVDVTRPDSKDQYIYLTGDDIPILNLIFVWIIPSLVSLVGIVLLVRRKKQ
jgi:ABC-2 type transport system permease protein